MLTTRAAWRFVPGETELVQCALRSPRGIVARIQTRGLPALELGGGAPQGDRRWLWSVGRGEAYLDTTAGETIVRAGEVYVGDEGEAALRHTSADADLLVGYFTAAGVERPRGALASDGRAAHAAVAAALLRGDEAQVGAAVRALGVALGAAGLEAACAPGPAEPAPRRLAGLVQRGCGQLAAHPGLVDLADALGRSERRASEDLGAYFRAYHASFSGWRAYLSTLRVELALGLLSDPGHRAADIAAWLGYRGASAMYHALARRGCAPDALRGAV